MPEPYFQFRQFRVYHHRDVLKVGTDGVLLGAWAEVRDGDTVLDIGTGTGLIALMLAQRAHIRCDAIDISSGAAGMAATNFARSRFSDLKAHEGKLEQFRETEAGLYSLIVCNPPFFTSGKLSDNRALGLAKHAVSLAPDALFSHAARLLGEDGRLSVIFPAAEPERGAFLHAAGGTGLHMWRMMEVFPLPDRPAVRLMVEFRKQPCATAVQERMTVELQAGRTGYHEDYKRLTGEFYTRF